jgi:hypothetical protein
MKFILQIRICKSFRTHFRGGCKNAINDMLGDNAPGQDGYTRLFFKKCWNIIKCDNMRVVNQFGNLHIKNFHWLNSTNIVLIPKKEG